MSAENPVLVEKRGGLGIVTINRPKVLNAIDWKVFEILQGMIDDLIADSDTRVIIITGAGKKAFISGGDIGAELEMDGLMSYRWSFVGHKLCATLEASPKPVIAAVNGYCLGGGFEVALACDFRICSDNAKFGTPESKLGVCCGFGGNVRLPRIVGRTKALEMLMTGLMIDAEEAYRVNLVNKVVPQAENLLNKSAVTLDIIKRAADYGSEMDLRSAAQYEAALFGVISATYDKVEGMTAFLEKRPPKFLDK